MDNECAEPENSELNEKYQRIIDKHVLRDYWLLIRRGHGTGPVMPFLLNTKDSGIRIYLLDQDPSLATKYNPLGKGAGNALPQDCLAPAIHKENEAEDQPSFPRVVSFIYSLNLGEASRSGHFSASSWGLSDDGLHTLVTSVPSNLLWR